MQDRREFTIEDMLKQVERTLRKAEKEGWDWRREYSMEVSPDFPPPSREYHPSRLWIHIGIDINEPGDPRTALRDLYNGSREKEE